jgi:predicted nucleic acid-binding protein
MTATLNDIFADTVFWIALVVKQDQHHERARRWSQRITGRITTTVPVLLETANALARPAWRAPGVVMLERLMGGDRTLRWYPSPPIFGGVAGRCIGTGRTRRGV